MKLFCRYLQRLAFVCAVTLSFFSPSFLRADSPPEPFPERITSFTTYIELHEDRSARIIENIIYDFGTGERHGIFRDIPYRYKGVGGANDDIPLSDFSVTRAGAPEPFSVSRSGGEVHVKIGDADKTISGAHEYRITYTAHEITGSFEDSDEVYWNATGNGWNVPIDSAEVLISLPRDIIPPDARLACYVGRFGSTENCAPDLSLFSRTFKEFIFTSPRSLGPGEGMTVALGFPKGIIKERTAADIAAATAKANGIILLPVIVFIFMFIHWRRNGKDPKGRGVIVPEYDVPERLTPLLVGTLMSQWSSPNHVSAGIIYLAVHGYVKVAQVDEKVLGIIPKKEYVFTKLKEGNVLAGPEKVLLEKLFSKSSSRNAEGQEEVKLSDLKNHFSEALSKIRDASVTTLVGRGYYVKKPSSVVGPYAVVGGLLIFVSVLVGVVTDNLLYLFSLAITGVICLIFGFVMPKVTKEGAIVKEKILGLKDYLQIAEKDRLKFHNAPEKKPEVFEKLLPYAMVLGVEKAWAKEFEGIYRENPSWYAGPHGATFSAIAFTNDMHSFAAATTTAVNPHSSSGSGGGGFSGGGGGGGGGGSW